MAIFRGIGGAGDSTTDATITEVTQQATNAAASATAASSSASSAATSASQASGYLATVQTSADNAATSETNAAASATTASNKAQDAINYAANAQTFRDETQTLKNQTDSIRLSAVTFAGIAESHADDAEAAQTAAETAEANTLAIFGDAQDVQDAVDDAEKLAVNPEDSQYTLSDSVTTGYSALHYAAKAEDSAALAQAGKDDAETASDAATVSSTLAATYASNASDSADDAAVSASQALTYKNAAENRYDLFNDRFLGQITGDPDTDNNGDPLITGALYFNSIENEIRVYTGSAWEPIQELSGDQTVNSLTSNNDVVVKGNLEVQGTTITVDSATAQTIDLGDNDKIRFGDGDDLQIYHDGSQSWIDDAGTGNLNIRGGGGIFLRSPANEVMIQAVGNGAVTLYYDNSAKLATTSSGVDITGTLVSDGLTIDGSAGPLINLYRSDVNALFGAIQFKDTTNTNENARIGWAANELRLQGTDKVSLITDEKTRLFLASTGDISFYEDTGTTAKLAWDASTEELIFKDNVKAEFGDGGDLQIFHNGSNSYIREAGTGNLVINANDFKLKNSTDSEFMIDARQDGAVYIYHDGSQKLATTSTGIDVTGTVLADGLTVDGDGVFDGDTSKVTIKAFQPKLIFDDDSAVGGGSDKLILQSVVAQANGDYEFVVNNDQTSATDQPILKLYGRSDIAFYDDSGSSQDFYWDASTSRLGLGTTTPSTTLDVAGTVTADGLTSSGILRINSTGPDIRLIESDTTDLNGRFVNAGGQLLIQTMVDAESAVKTRILIDHSSGDVALSNDSGTSQDFYWDASTSRLGLGTTSPSGNLDITTNSIVSLDIQGGDGNSKNIIFRKTTDGIQQAKISAVGDDLRFTTGTTSERMRIDSSGNVGIGTTSPSSAYTGANNLVIGGGSAEAGLTIYSSTTTDGNIYFADGTAAEGAAAYRGYLEYSHNSNYFRIGVNGSEAMRIDSSGRLGIGTTSPDKALVVSGVGAEIVINDTDTTDTPLLRFRESGSTSATIFTDGGNLIFTYGSTQAARIDSSGNLLVGKTSPSISTAGGEIRSSGIMAATVSNGTPLYLSRLSTDGEIINFRKDGTTVGSIASRAGVLSEIVLDPRSGSFQGAGIAGSGEAITPMDHSQQADAHTSLGNSSFRWKDLYLSSGVYLGGTGSANLLDDYEEGTFTPTFGGSTTDPSGITYDAQIGQYTKVGRIVHIAMRLGTDAITSVGSGNLRIRGLPFNTAYALGVGTPVAYNFNGFLNTYQMLLGSDYLDFYDASGYASTSFLATGTNANRLWVYFSYQTA